jgi:SAM-dependent methyltransferase
MTFRYVGEELDLFRHAVNWKRYYASRLLPFITGDTLEVGAGIGGTSRFLCDGSQRSWTCLEPDRTLMDSLKAVLHADPLPVPVRVLPGTVADLPTDEHFDTILYIDVLEHIMDDRSELDRSSAHLRPGGLIVVLSPAHDWLFSPFDRAIGHYRRYSIGRLRELTPHRMRLASAFYLDSVGMVASLANRLLMKKASPTLAQIRFWDSTLVRLSRVLDPITGRRVGKTVIAIWRKLPDSH